MPARFVQMKKVAAEIADKRRRNVPLVPDLKVIEVRYEPVSTAGQF
jgi:hypothetical protein